MSDSIIKDQGKGILIKLGYTIGILLLIRILGLQKWSIILLLVIISNIQGAISADPVKSMIKRSILIVILLNVLFYIARFGIIGFIISVVAICAWILASRWDRYIEAKEQIESMIWGKPLMQYHMEGKLPPKLRFRL